MSPQHRRFLVFAGLAGAVALTIASPERGEPDVVVTAPKARAAASPTPGRTERPVESTQWNLALVERRRAVELTSDAFAARSWDPPPPPPKPLPVAPIVMPTIEVPPAPTAPPLPFQYVGRIVQDGSTLFFIQRGDRLLTVQAGETIENNYRVDGLRGRALALTYLPLNQLQTLDTGVQP